MQYYNACKNTTETKDLITPIGKEGGDLKKKKVLIALKNK